ncbi:hypothetical protein GCM10010954_14540 [Halobacillus andaensis]|uniref:Uncharacterized protein n=1 Tax=Halobacillus andaensis TaxID=1176239 RepID=A0A917EWM3_HALAA|nr:hypothetical protein [Halobacillus andaensis]MBP2004258.1 hypothetical protein [Halobacillus andaensis]GGF16973.1 hypothetical protein GCM10010954_14540 [Halobacillus andaensis]
MKKKLNMETQEGSKLIKELTVKVFQQITEKEVMELRKIFEVDSCKYQQLIKLKYIGPLGLLSLNYVITKEVEAVLYEFINEILHKVPVSGSNNYLKLEIQ